MYTQHAMMRSDSEGKYMLFEQRVGSAGEEYPGAGLALRELCQYIGPSERGGKEKDPSNDGGRGEADGLWNLYTSRKPFGRTMRKDVWEMNVKSSMPEGNTKDD